MRATSPAGRLTLSSRRQKFFNTFSRTALKLWLSGLYCCDSRLCLVGDGNYNTQAVETACQCDGERYALLMTRALPSTATANANTSMPFFITEAGLLWCPERVGVQPLAEALVSVNRGLDQFPSSSPFRTQIGRDLDQRTGEQMARHRQLL
jgi:hypothetical protein